MDWEGSSLAPHPPAHPQSLPTGADHIPIHSRVGGGFPVATQWNSAGWPGCTVSCAGLMVAVGALACVARARRRAG